MATSLLNAKGRAPALVGDNLGRGEAVADLLQVKDIVSVGGVAAGVNHAKEAVFEREYREGLNNEAGVAFPGDQLIAVKIGEEVAVDLQGVSITDSGNIGRTSCGRSRAAKQRD